MPLVAESKGSHQSQPPFLAGASGLRVGELWAWAGNSWELGVGVWGQLGLARWRSTGLGEAWESDTDKDTANH